MQEIWKDIPGYENLYQVSNIGNVRSLHNRYKNKEYLKPCINGKGYLLVSLCKNHSQKSINVHRLVAQVFIPNPNNLPCINHKDENKQNNNVDNLEWCTYQYNNTYGQRLTKSALKQGIPVKCIETEVIYSSAYAASRATGIWQSGICLCCKGRKKTAGNFHWQYV